MKTSDLGINFIAKWEGLRLEKYKDIVGVWTIGYGHAIKPGENYSVITQEQALQILKDDLVIAEDAVKLYITVPLTQNQFDALVSFAFNLGRGMLDPAKHTLSAALNKKDYIGAANQFILYDHAGGKEDLGLKNRRISERNIFLTPDVVQPIIKTTVSIQQEIPSTQEEPKQVVIPETTSILNDKKEVNVENNFFDIILNVLKSLFKF